MQTLAAICVRRPIFATMLILAMVVVGAVGYSRLGVDRLPSVDLPTISVRTALPGAAPEEVETEVSQVIEEVVNTVEGIEELRSISGNGQSIVVATFSLDRNIDAAAQDVRDRVATALRRLPDAAEPPIVSKFDNDSTPVLTLALSGSRSIRELTELADKVVRPQLERSGGVGGVQIVGGLERTINVWLDAERLAAHGLPVTAVRDAIARENANVPGGNVTGPQREQVLRTMGRLADAAAFDEVVIATVQGAPIRVRDVGRAEDGSRERRSSTWLDGEPAVSLEVRRQSGANSIEVIDGVKRELERLRPALPPGTRLEIIRDQSQYIEAALHEIKVHLVLGSILACLVVLGFMRSWRSVFIAGLAIPASVISTFAMMWALGFTLNSVTMLALVLMVGIVIDDAIVVLENIFRFVEEKGMPPMVAAIEGTREIGLAVLATTLSLVVIFIPVSFMSSISGRFLYQFGITAAVAVLVSLVVSFSLTPALAARMLRGERAARQATARPPGGAAEGAAGAAAGKPRNPHAEEPRSRRGLYGLVERSYLAMLRGTMRVRWIAAIAGLAIMLASVPLYGLLRQDYLPSDIDEAEFTVQISGGEGISFEAMDEAARAIDAEIRAHPQVRTTMVSTGGSFLGQVNSANIYVRIAPHAERYPSIGRFARALLAGDPAAAWRGNATQADVMQELRRALRAHRDVRIGVRNFPAFTIGGAPVDIDLAIRGPELEQLAAFADELRRRGRELGGLPDLDTTLKLDTPELRVTIDRERAADLGVSARDIGLALRLLVGGDEEISRFRDPREGEDYDVALRLAEEGRRDASGIPRLLIPAASGGTVELRSIATLEPATAAARIDRIDRQRAASIRGSIAPGYSLGDRVQALLAVADDLDMPAGYTIRVQGRGRELERTFREFLWAFALSIIFMYMILAANYESLVHPFTILLSLPLCLPFALLSLWLMGGTLNLYSALGILVLFGVVKKNSILQIDHMNQLRRAGLPRDEAILIGNRDRLRPILMTTLSLVGGMLPLALGTGPGAEERRAIAVVVIGGQMLALLITLLYTPVAYSILDDLGRWLGIRTAGTEPEEAEAGAGLTSAAARRVGSSPAAAATTE
ncbi:MAG TPA: efflux RND transporter permease subunit [Phycisphaerales bacterium]|nr:efflux RND transporter permease subunit [Phycisphaerales bacterium]HMP36837.1 efflux RND transporter permease subunit [Phycisphaerales bacterium]